MTAAPRRSLIVLTPTWADVTNTYLAGTPQAWMTPVQPWDNQPAHMPLVVARYVTQPVYLRSAGSSAMPDIRLTFEIQAFPDADDARGAWTPEGAGGVG